MLVEFRTKNFRSLKSDAAITMVASIDKTNSETSLIETKHRSIPRLLRAAGIYGANASGKSNLVRAINIMRAIVADSASLRPEQELNVQPFRLDARAEQEPIEFEVTFLREGVRYQFGFNASPQRILNEWLIVYEYTQPATWYERTYEALTNRYSYKFGARLKGSRKVWRDATRANALFLSTAVQLNSEQLRGVFDWITRSLIVFDNGMVPSLDYTVSHIAKHRGPAVAKFLSAADISIDEIGLKKTRGLFHEVRFDLAQGSIEPLSEQRDITVPTFTHSSKNGSAVFDLPDESEGTQKLFAMAGPLFDIFEQGQILVVDELDRSLHALLVRQLIDMFQNPEVNANGAQLIFTTHDTSLLEGRLLRRDQIWFFEKDAEQASRLYPLTDFSPRVGEAIERGYLAGRYGGIPVLRRLKPAWQERTQEPDPVETSEESLPRDPHMTES